MQSSAPVVSAEVHALVSRIPFLADTRELSITPLQGVISLNNTNYRVSADGMDYVLRVASDTAPLLGIRRDEEAESAVAAARAGVAPEVLYFDNDGNMVTPLIQGRHWEPEDFHDEGNVRRLAETLRRLHDVKEVRPRAEGLVSQRVESLVESAGSLGVELPTDMEVHREKMRELDEMCRADTRFSPGLSHNDLWANNFIDDGKQLWFLDWEFSGTGHGLYDLATLSFAGGYSPEEQSFLLRLYGYTAPADLQRLQSMKYLVHLFEGCWSLVQHGLRGSDGFNYLDHSKRMLDALRG
jgi:thiamine kinase-like enzyme